MHFMQKHAKFGQYYQANSDEELDDSDDRLMSLKDEYNVRLDTLLHCCESQKFAKADVYFFVQRINMSD